MSYALHYDRWMPTEPDAVRVLARRKLAQYLPHLPSDRDALIVDMGSGPGLLGMALAELGYREVVSFDADASQAAHGRNLNVDIHHVPVTQTGAFLAAMGGRAELFLLIDVLEHIEPDAQLAVLAAIRGAMAPGARLICQVPNADSPVGLRYRYVDWTHRCGFTFESLHHVLALAGFRVEAVSDSPAHRLSGFGTGPKSWAWYALSLTVRGAARLKMLPYLGREVAFGAPLAANMMAVAIKDESPPVQVAP